jgi:two-component system cell cycle sensor histidine kinase/response regulator CckA
VPMQSQGVIDHVMAIATNITEQRRAERAAAASERKFQTIFNAVNDGVFISGLDGRILEINEPACRMLGYSRGELLQKNLRDLDTAEHAARVSSRIEQIEERGQILYEAVQRAKDGRLVPVEVSARPIELDGLTALAGVVRDITERKRGEGERLELERRLLHAQKLESLGVLAGGIAHDFNNLLMAILGNLDLAGLTLPPTSPARNSIDQAIQATRRATDLTRQLLAYSGRGRFVVTRVDLAELARENADLFRSVMARTVTLNLSTNLQPCPIEADPGQVQQVIMNLITNASEAVGESGGVVTLTTGLITCDEAYLEQSRLEDKPNAGRFAYVEVTDTGCGMTAGTQERLFDPFFSTKFTGRGLGMSAVLGIVRGHGGAILVDSKEGLGTTVRVLFPTLQTELPKPAPPVLAPAAGRLESRLAGKVLVVDDESAVRALCQRYLEHLGFEALEAASGERALSLIAESNSSIGLIVLDLTMPEMDGVVAFHEIARRWPTIPVILSSGFSEEDVMQRFSGAVPAAFVQKPYRLQELQESVAKALAAGREAAERQR